LCSVNSGRRSVVLKRKGRVACDASHAGHVEAIVHQVGIEH
jgi:hypothetical protein